MIKLRDTIFTCVLLVSIAAVHTGFKSTDQRLIEVSNRVQGQYNELQDRIDAQARTLGTIVNTLLVHDADLREIQSTFALSILDTCGLITDGEGHGSCVAIGEDLMLTAGHCIGYVGSWIEIDKKKYEIVEEWASDKYDVGFVRIKGKLPFAQLGLMPHLLDEVYAVGAPASPDFVINISKGVVTKLGLDWWDYSNAVVIDSAGWYGNSGGPVFNKDGEIVAILVAGPASELDNVNVCVPVCQIRSALRTYLSR